MATFKDNIYPSGKKPEDVVSFSEELFTLGIRGINENGILNRYKMAKRYYAGDHKIKARSERLGNLVWNKFAEIAQARTAHVVAKRPKWKFMPRQEGWQLMAADALNQALGDVLWDIIEWEDKGEDSVNEARDAGSSHIKAIVTSTGFPDFIPIPANQIVIDPKAKKKKQMRFWFHVYAMSTTQIERDYGVKVSAESEVSLTSNETSTFNNPMMSYEASGDDTGPVLQDDPRQSTSQTLTQMMPDVIGRAIIKELWVEDLALEQIPYKAQETDVEHQAFGQNIKVLVSPEENHVAHIKAHEKYLATLDPELDKFQIQSILDHMEIHSGYPQEEKRRKYPYGRKIVTCQNKLLYDRPNPIAEQMEGTPLDFRDLLIKWDWDKLTGSWWGKQGVSDLFDPQDALNHRINSITQNINMLNNGVKTMLTRSYNALKGSLKKLSNMIGITIPVKNHDDFKITFGPPLPPQYFQDLFHIENFMDTVSGNTAILGGEFPKGSPPGVTVNQLLGMGMVRINMIVKHYAFALQQMARVAMSLMIEFLPDQTMFRILGNDDQGKPIWKMIDWGKLKEEAGKFDIHVDIDSMLSTSRQEILDETIKLYQAGLYDRQAALERVDDPKKWEIIKRISEIMILQQQNQVLSEQNSKMSNEVQRLMQNIRGMQEKPNASSDKE